MAYQAYIDQFTSGVLLDKEMMNRLLAEVPQKVLEHFRTFTRAHFLDQANAPGMADVFALRSVAPGKVEMSHDVQAPDPDLAERATS